MSAGDDIRHMRHALRLAERSLGAVAPNPAVGCVIVVVGRPHRRPRAHARRAAGRMRKPWRSKAAGAAARGATAYVTLEPCSHHGQTPPCADALVAAGVDARRRSGRRSRSARERARRRAAARCRHRRRCRRSEERSGRSEPRVLFARHSRAAAGHAQDRAKPRRPHGVVIRRKQMDHGSRSARLRPSAARAPRRDPYRHRNGAGRRSRTDVPHSGARSAFAVARRARHAPAPDGVVEARADGARCPHACLYIESARRAARGLRRRNRAGPARRARPAGCRASC